KISKRKNPAARLLWFREQGYLPEALVNFLQLLGYAGDDDGEVQSFDDFVAQFDWAKVNTVGPVFDLDKLNWLNGYYIRALASDELADRIVEHLRFTGVEVPAAHVETLRAATPLIQERLVLLSEALEKIQFLLTPDAELALDADSVAKLPDNAAEIVDASLAALESAPTWDAATIQAALRERLVDQMGIKPKFAFGPARVGVTGSRVSPPLFESMEILGRDSTLARLQALRAAL
ncbi:MAG: glutamate--tRNA ligase family protein, partial [Propionibacteriaceae bacterium]|nr:glutamate--tRNA ligase family protein [Propionibacteriaceae bacterium]